MCIVDVDQYPEPDLSKNEVQDLVFDLRRRLATIEEKLDLLLAASDD